ncbi:hypothetical protein SUGI_0271160 [Cryptomeria japonica]|uniref:uncharacterized protein LOC131045310 n=1 Tax=Cryptomeria japonica TaxID=3369 RepID=UPI002408ABE6|nr:uncharacterized protein LOC131045310 [Cryptomeria japonica]GLJ16206.1 hypothetical protein SUGI_0271160 [Cryptomeria japonica]
MRYQGGSQEDSPASDGNKTHFKVNKRNENGVAIGKFVCKKNQAVILKGKGEMSKGAFSNNNNSYHPDSSFEPLNGNIKNQEDQKQPMKNRIPGGDLLSQWRQKKRSRGCRANMVDDSARKSDINATRNGDHIPSICHVASIHPTNITSLPMRRSPEYEAACGSNGVLFNKRAEEHSPESSCVPDKITPCKDGDVGDCIAPASLIPSEIEAFAQPPENMDMDKFPWPRILIALSRKEKECDFLVIKGSKLPQRPKKRPKIVERNLQNCCPGFWLSDVARGRYDVREKKSIKKKPMGLKAMESTGSDSD